MGSKARNKPAPSLEPDPNASVPAEDCSEGTFLGFEDGQVVGWAWDGARPERMLTVDLFADGLPIGSARAGESSDRAPETVAGHAFRVKCTNLDKVKPPFFIRGKIRESEKELGNCLIIGNDQELNDWLQPFEGEVFCDRPGRFRGWAIRANAPDQAVIVEVFCDGEVIDTIAADQSQPYSRFGAGHGFAFASKTSDEDHVWEFRVAGTRFPLPQSSERLAIVSARQIDSRLDELEQEARRSREALAGERARQDAALALFARELVRHVDAVLAIQRDAFLQELRRLHPGESPGALVAPNLAPKGKAVKIIMGEQIVGFGWRSPESGEHGRSPFRWMADTASLVAPFTSDTDAQIEIEIEGAARLDGPGDLSVLVNGAQASGGLQADEDGGWIYRGAVPAAAFFGTPISIVTLSAIGRRLAERERDEPPPSFAVHAVALAAVADASGRRQAQQTAPTRR